MVPRVLEDSALAMFEGRKSNCSIAFRTRPAVSCDTGPLPEITREAVPTPTPARRATSLIVATGDYRVEEGSVIRLMEALPRLPIVATRRAQIPGSNALLGSDVE